MITRCIIIKKEKEIFHGLGERHASHHKRDKDDENERFHVSNGEIVALIVAFGMVGIGIFGAGNGFGNLPTLLGNTPREFLPIASTNLVLNVNGVDYPASSNNKVTYTDAEGESITVPAAKYIDSSGSHVSLEAYCSGAWLSDANGNPLKNGTEAVQISPYQAPINGTNSTELIFEYTADFTYQTVIRTGPEWVTNFPWPVHTLTPFAGTVYDGMYLDGTLAYNGRTYTDWMGTSYVPTFDPSSIYGEDIKGALISYEWVMGGLYNQITPDSVRWQTNVMSTSFNAGYNSGSPPDHSPAATGITYPNTGDARQAKITTSLVPVSYPTADGSWYDAGHDASILGNYACNANSKVLNYMAAAPTAATIKVNITGNGNQFKSYNQTYVYTAGNGSKYTILCNTVSAPVGFTGIDPTGYISGGMNAASPVNGIVPNINSAHSIPTYGLPLYTGTNPTTTGTGGSNETNYNGAFMSPNNNAVTVTQKSLSAVSSTGATNSLAGGIDVAAQRQFVTQSGSASAGALSESVKGSSYPISSYNVTNVANNSNMPKSLLVSNAVTLQPQVNVADAYATLTWSRGEEKAYSDWEGIHADGGATPWESQSYTQTISWPYGASQDNEYWTRNYTVPVMIISERNFQALDSNGHSIPLSSIWDNLTNAVYHDPRADNLHVTMSPPVNLNDPCNQQVSLLDPTSWGYGLQCFWNNYWWVFALIAIIPISYIAIDIYAKVRPITIKDKRN